MSPAQTRRPALATSFSTHNIFCRPIIPPPAPVVYVNGWDGVGKGTVSECLTLLLGKDKSLLIDVRSVGWDIFEEPRCDDIPSTINASHHNIKKLHEHHHHFLLTPEHPRYSSFDTDYGVASMASPSLSSASSASPINQSTPFRPVSSPWAITTPCSSENLTRLLSHPSNRDRIAVLPTCAPDTPGGRATLRTFEAAASRAGRLFVPVVLTCSPAEHARRIHGGVPPSLSGEAVLGGGGGGGDSSSAVSRMMMQRLHLRRRGASEGGGGSGSLGLLRGLSGSMHHPEHQGVSCSSASFGNGPVGCEKGGEGKTKRPLSVPGPEIGTGPGMGMGMGVGWAKGQGLATPMSTKVLTVDTTSVTPFEAALHIVEFVRGLQAELDAELSSMGGSTQMPTDKLDRLKRGIW